MYSNFQAGHYIPAIANEILQSNVAAKDDKTLNTINFKSVAIGNGLTDPLVQYKYYSDMAADTKYGPILEESVIEEMESKVFSY